MADVSATPPVRKRRLFWHPPYSSIVVVVPAAVPAAPVIWTVIVAVPAMRAMVARLVVVISIPIVPAVRAIVVRAPPAPSPGITNPANLVDIGWRCRGRLDRHGAGAGCGEQANCSGRCNSKDGISHLMLHRIEDAAYRWRDELPVNSRRGLSPNQTDCGGDVKFRTIGKFVSRRETRAAAFHCGFQAFGEKRWPRRDRSQLRIRSPRVGYNNVSRRIPIAVQIDSSIEAVPIVGIELCKPNCAGSCDVYSVTARRHLFVRLYLLYG